MADEQNQRSSNFFDFINSGINNFQNAKLAGLIAKRAASIALTFLPAWGFIGLIAFILLSVFIIVFSGLPLGADTSGIATISGAPTQPVPSGGTPPIQPSTPPVAGMHMFKGNARFYCQVDSQWNNACNVNYDGCGPTSVAMVTSSFGINYNPVQMSYIFRDVGAKTCNSGDDSNRNYIGWLKSNGFDVISVPNDQSGNLNLSEAAKYIDTGYIILGSSLAAPCPPHPPAWGCKPPKTTVSHLFVVDGVNPSGNSIAVLDPINCNTDHPGEFSGSGRTLNNSFGFLYALAIRKRQN